MSSREYSTLEPFVVPVPPRVSTWAAIRQPGKIARYLVDRRAPNAPRMILLAGVLYALIPTDLLADRFGPIGWVDDAILMLWALGYCVRRATECPIRRSAPPPSQSWDDTARH